MEPWTGGNTSEVLTKRGISWMEMGSRKYLIEVDGHGYQASLAAKMLLRSVVLSQSSGWRLWYEPFLTNMTHLVSATVSKSRMPVSFASQ